MVEPRAFIFVGSREPDKRQRYDLLKRQLFPSEIADLNTRIFYAEEHSWSVRDLQEAMADLPTEGARQRLVVLRNAHRADRATIAFLTQMFKDVPKSVLFLADIPDEEEAAPFLEAWQGPGVQVVRFKGASAGPGAFDLARAILSRKPDAALGILSGLLKEKERPERILGALLWQWDRAKEERRLDEAAYKKGLGWLTEADRRLKKSAFGKRQDKAILEVLVVKLSLGA
jgi:hypothetical protein